MIPQSPVDAPGRYVLETDFWCRSVHDKHAFFEAVEELFIALAGHLGLDILETDPTDHHVDDNIDPADECCVSEELKCYLASTQVLIIHEHLEWDAVCLDGDLGEHGVDEWVWEQGEPDEVSHNYGRMHLAIINRGRQQNSRVDHLIWEEGLAQTGSEVGHNEQGQAQDAHD